MSSTSTDTEFPKAPPDVETPELPPVQAEAKSNQMPDVLIANGPSDVMTKELLELYFESRRAGSCGGALEDCVILSPGKAQLKFKNPEGNTFCEKCV